MKTHARFLDYVDTLDYMEVCRVVISREGEYSIPSEKDGRISLVSPTTRKALGNFLRSENNSPASAGNPHGCSHPQVAENTGREIREIPWSKRKCLLTVLQGREFFTGP